MLALQAGRSQAAVPQRNRMVAIIALPGGRFKVKGRRLLKTLIKRQQLFSCLKICNVQVFFLLNIVGFFSG